MEKCKFKHGDIVKYIKEAPEDAGMVISIGTLGRCEETESGNIVVQIFEYRIPLIGVFDITHCFELVNE